MRMSRRSLLFGGLVSATGLGQRPERQNVGSAQATVTNAQVASVFEFMTAAEISDVQSGKSRLDITSALQKAIDSISHGGRVFIPAGKYKVTDTITLAAGVSIQGATATDFVNGARPNSSATPSFIWQASPGKAIFEITGAMSNVRISDLALSPALRPSTTPLKDGRVGIALRGSYPDFAWNIVFDRIIFYNLDYGIECVDPHAGREKAPFNFDWSIAPVNVRDSRFLHTGVGVYINTNNADDWSYDRCQFQVPSGGIGVYLYSYGFQHFTDCIAGGNSVADNKFIRIFGNGRHSADNVLLDNCQAETLTRFIDLDNGGAYNLRFNLTMRNCIAELGAGVYLANKCHFVSMHNRWTASVEIDSANVIVSSLFDHFDPGYEFVVSRGNPREVFYNVLRGPDSANGPSPFQNGVFLSGYLYKYDTAPPLRGTWRVGDRVINSAPAYGKPKAWICIAAGTPGTWASEGNL